jgi:60 kDa SS-A/Ro ribonucleoprotein
MWSYLKSVFLPPQTAPIPGAAQVPNHAGGFGWEVDDWARLDRFLILGTEAGTYYVTQHKLSLDATEGVLRCVAADGPRVVARVVEVSKGGRAPRVDPAIFVLAICMKLGDDPTRKLAHDAVPEVCRIGTHLFALADHVSTIGGWGRATRRAFTGWYTRRPAERIAYDLVKYQARNGWSHRDLLRLAKPAGFGPETPHGSLFRWVTKGWDDIAPVAPDEAHLRLVWAFERAKRADVAETVRLIQDHGLPRECVATQHLQSPAVWEALLLSGDGMPMSAMIRSLGKMSQVGLLTPLSRAAEHVAVRLSNVDALRAARVHPLTLLSAQLVYAAGKGERGSLTWTPVSTVVDALDAAFYTSFVNAPRTGRRVMLCVDVSGSMGGTKVSGMPRLPAATAAAAMALVTAATEPNHLLLGFNTNVVDLPISPRMRLAEATRVVEARIGGGTDCAAPILHARSKRLPVDAFVMLTDSETWAGSMHPAQAIQAYRSNAETDARLAVVAMCSTATTIADPKDGGTINLVGFDAAVPEVLASFIQS